MEMSRKAPITILVGDNPFHGVSHLAQAASRKRNANIYQSKYAANLVISALENGADGFMFSASETTLSILREIKKTRKHEDMKLYAIIPYAYQSVRLATSSGGIPGLAKQMIKQILRSMNLRALGYGVKGVITMDLDAVMKTYVLYEISRINSVAGKDANLVSVILHEVITEMALAFNLESLFKSYIKFLKKREIEPGFETRNFALLINKFRKWDIDLREVGITTAFNKVGFQMNPSKAACEEALMTADGADIVAMNILASGYLKPPEAVDYIRTLPNLTGVVAGVSNEQQAKETFGLLKTLKT
jgi:hypothetical protein